jgi:mRNA interferase RelE/StbE
MPESAKAGSYRIFQTSQFSKDLATFGPEIQARLEIKLRDLVYPTLRQNPNFGPNIKRLRNWQPPTWRYRVGEWRFFYEIDDKAKTVYLIAADHRKQAYRRG